MIHQKDNLFRSMLKALRPCALDAMGQLTCWGQVYDFYAARHIKKYVERLYRKSNIQFVPWIMGEVDCIWYYDETYQPPEGTSQNFIQNKQHLV